MRGNDHSRLALDRVVFFGRTLEEYSRFFDLDLVSLRGQSVLDCPAGASSFAAEATRLGIRAVAVDPEFAHSLQALKARGQRDIGRVMDGVVRVSHLFVWEAYDSVPTLRAARSRALDGFCEDFEAGRAAGRYQPAALPHLPFRNGAFDWALSGHFLFVYGGLLDYEFHLASLKELVRVCRCEVRVYPLQGLDARPYCELERLRAQLEADGIPSEIRQVDFEFQRGSTNLLALQAGSSGSKR